MTPPRDLALIYNPASGRGRGARSVDQLLQLLEGRRLAVRKLPTQSPGHAVALARQVAREGADLLLALGGDGTVRDVAEGLGGASLPVGLLPAGTGNDLARTLGIPQDLSTALEIALSGHPRALDVWRWNDTPFVNIAGVGVDAAVAATVNRKYRSLSGTLAYVAAFLTTFPTYQPFEIRLRGPQEEWSGKIWLAAFANGRCYGGGMKIAPTALPDDGLLEVVIVEAIPRLELLGQFPRIFSGTHLQHPRVHRLRVPSIEIETAPQQATIDGEIIGSTPARITRSEHPLRVQVPGGSASTSR